MPELDPIAPQPTPAPQDGLAVIARVRNQLGSLNDNITHGEPHFQEHVPSFDDERWLGLLENAVGRVNMRSSPKTGFTMETFAYGDPIGGYALYLSLLIEAIKHFIITYTEEPDTMGLGTAPYLSRRDYWTRWQTTLSLLEDDFGEAADAFKYGMLGFGKAAVLIGGRSVPYGYTPKVRPSSRYGWGWR